MNALRFLMVMAVSLVFTAASHAVSIGVNFNSGRNTATGLLPAESAGAGGFAQTNWNNTDFRPDTQGNGNMTNITGGVLVDNTGAATGATISWASQGTWSNNNGASNGDNKMMNGYIDAIGGGGSVQINFANIPYSVYDIVVYFGSDVNGRTGQVTDGTTTFSYSTDSAQNGGFPGAYVQTTDTGTGNPNSNYAVFANVTGSQVNIIRGSNNSGIHGIQIVDRGRVIPEPATMALFGLAGAVVLLRRRR